MKRLGGVSRTQSGALVHVGGYVNDTELSGRIFHLSLPLLAVRPLFAGLNGMQQVVVFEHLDRRFASVAKQLQGDVRLGAGTTVVARGQLDAVGNASNLFQGGVEQGCKKG